MELPTESDFTEIIILKYNIYIYNIYTKLSENVLLLNLLTIFKGNYNVLCIGFLGILSLAVSMPEWCDSSSL